MRDHFAVHGQTAAEMIISRADSSKPLMGLVNFKGNYITLQDVKIAKNYLTEKELHQLNLIVSLYLDFAELQATNGRLMKMKDWIAKLDDFLKLSEKELLTHAGNVGAETAAQKAEAEFDKYRAERSKTMISYNMSKIKSKGSVIENIMASALCNADLRGYRRNSSTVFGKPDFSWKKYKVAVFCDSAFWHG